MTGLITPIAGSTIDSRVSPIITGSIRITAHRNRDLADADYDALVRELEALEAEHPELITTESPTQRVGGAPLAAFDEVQHRVPMLSMDNTYSVDELRKYGDRVAKLLEGEPIEFLGGEGIELVDPQARVDVPRDFHHGIIFDLPAPGNRDPQKQHQGQQQ